jgi:hypothetical protein
MRVFVASLTICGQHTQSVLKNIDGRSLVHFVAFPAVNFLVLAFQLEMGFAVVKFAQRTLIGEGLGVVAFLTIKTQMPLVLVLVTIGAAFERHIRKFLKLCPVADLFFVAFYAGHIAVFTRERKVGLVVVEFFGRVEFIGIVAFCAILAKRFLVGVFVAIHTFLPDTQKGVFLLFQFRLLHKI